MLWVLNYVDIVARSDLLLCDFVFFVRKSKLGKSFLIPLDSGSSALVEMCFVFSAGSENGRFTSNINNKMQEFLVFRGDDIASLNPGHFQPITV